MATQVTPVRIEGFPRGMDNRRKDFDLPESVLRDALNVDILSSGRVRMRRGPRQVFADNGAHSVYADGQRLFWATATALKSAAPGASVSSLLSDTRLAAALSWLTLHGESYFSNEAMSGLVNVAGAFEPWGIVPPAAPPVVAGNGGSPGSRTVQLTCTFLAKRIALDGTIVLEESGAPATAQASVSDTPVIQVSAIPQSSDSRVVATRLYVSGLNGKELNREVDVPAGVTTWWLQGASLGMVGEPLKTQFMSNPPPGQLLEYHNGAIYIAVGNLVIATEPLRYGLFDNESKFFMFPKRVTLLKAVPHGVSRVERAGMFVGAGKTYFLPDIGTAEVDQKLLLEYDAIEGAAIHVPNSDDVMWLSERGVMRGSSGGKVENLTEAQISMDKYSRAAMGFFERDGHRAVIAVGKSATALPLVSQDWAADEAERKAEVE